MRGRCSVLIVAVSLLTFLAWRNVSNVLPNRAGPVAGAAHERTQVDELETVDSSAQDVEHLFCQSKTNRSSSFERNTTGLASEHELRLALNVSFAKVKSLASHFDEDSFHAASLYFAAVENRRPRASRSYDAVAPLSTFANHVTMQDCVYPFLAQTVKPGPIIIRLRISPKDEGRRRLDWLGHVVVDSDCRLALAPMVSWTMYRCGYARPGEMLNISRASWIEAVSACHTLRSCKQLPSSLYAMVLPRGEHYYCVVEALAPGDAVVLVVNCMTRCFARYPTAAERKGVSVLFPDVPQYPGLRNIIDLFRKYLTEVTFTLLPVDTLIVVEDGSELHMPQHVCRIPPQRHRFMWNEVFRRVNETLSQELVPHRRVALMSYQKLGESAVSLTNRSFLMHRSFLEQLSRFGFVQLPPTAPHDEKMYYMNNADCYITSLGSNDAVLAEYGGQINQKPRLMLIHSDYLADYVDESSMICNPREVLCKRGILWMYFPPDNDLRKVPSSLLEDFLEIVEGYKNGTLKYTADDWNMLRRYRMTYDDVVW